MSFQSRKQVEHGNNLIRSRSNAVTRGDLGRLIDTAHARVSVFPAISEAISYITTNSEHQADAGKQLLLAPTTAQPINIACNNSGVNNVSLSLSSLISVQVMTSNTSRTQKTLPPKLQKISPQPAPPQQIPQLQLSDKRPTNHLISTLVPPSRTLQESTQNVPKGILDKLLCLSEDARYFPTQLQHRQPKM
jgi:hypothetical protein